jgi:hypothetical protein
MRRKSWLAALAVSALALMFIAAPARAFAPTANGTDALCNEPSYVEVFDSTTGQRLSTLMPGGIITVTAFSLLHVRGNVHVDSRVIVTFQWAGSVTDLVTAPADGTCAVSAPPIPGWSFPLGFTRVTACFTPWEFPQMICGPLGYLNRVS